jgi:hypothetical protein
MKIDLSSIIEQLQTIESTFNDSKSSTERYILLQALNFIVDTQLRFEEDGWIMKQCREGMLREKGIV